MSRIPVGILGATGALGQHYVMLLKNHPWFELVFLGGREPGSYREAARRTWQFEEPIPDLPLSSLDDGNACALLFSALPNELAAHYDRLYATAGCTVISNASCHRMDPAVPLVIPEVNAHHLGAKRLIAKPNCALQSFLIALSPLHRRFGVKKLFVSTMQSLSGAGLSGLAACSMHDTLLPYIEGEEEKIAQESRKILEDDTLEISVQCTRVPVLYGHLADVSVGFAHQPSIGEILRCWEQFPSLPLPSAPKQTLTYVESMSTRHDCRRDKGMGVTISRLRACPLLDFRFCALAHNAVRGGAGGALLLAELIHGQKEPSFFQTYASLSLS